MEKLMNKEILTDLSNKPDNITNNKKEDSDINEIKSIKNKKSRPSKENNVFIVIEDPASSRNDDDLKGLNKFFDADRENELADITNNDCSMPNSLMDLKSWKDTSIIEDNNNDYGLILDTRTKCSGLKFSNIIGKRMNELKLHFKLLLRSPFSSEFYNKIERGKLKVLIGLDQDTNQCAAFAVLDYNNEYPLVSERYTSEQSVTFESSKCCANNFKDKNNTKAVTILALAVVKEYQKQGIGQSMLNRIIIDAQKQYCSKISLIVQSINLPAISLYRKFNFNTTKILENYYSFNNEDENKAILMTKRLEKERKTYFSDVINKIKDIILCKNSINTENSYSDDELEY